MAVAFVLRAVTHDRDRPAFCETSDEPQRELLAVVLDRAALHIDRAIHEELLPVFTHERGPRDAARLDVAKQPLAWTERRHPDVVAARRHSASTKARGQDAETVMLAVDRTPDRLRTNVEHFGESRVSINPGDGSSRNIERTFDKKSGTLGDAG